METDADSGVVPALAEAPPGVPIRRLMRAVRGLRERDTGTVLGALTLPLVGLVIRDWALAPTPRRRAQAFLGPHAGGSRPRPRAPDQPDPPMPSSQRRRVK
jgi:hypothetical protein